MCFYGSLDFLNVLEPPAAADIRALVFGVVVRERDGVVDAGEGLAVAAPDDAKAKAREGAAVLQIRQLVALVLDVAEVVEASELDMRVAGAIAELEGGEDAAVTAGFTLRIGTYGIVAANVELLGGVEVVPANLCGERGVQIPAIAQAFDMVDIEVGLLVIAFGVVFVLALGVGSIHFHMADGMHELVG